jgi:hypothetical protein
VDDVSVAQNFIISSLLDPNVVFVKGYFHASMPPLSKQVGEIALLRLDGDMYESTVDVLYWMYEKVRVNFISIICLYILLILLFIFIFNLIFIFIFIFIFIIIG